MARFELSPEQRPLDPMIFPSAFSVFEQHTMRYSAERIQDEEKPVVEEGLDHIPSEAGKPVSE